MKVVASVLMVKGERTMSDREKVIMGTEICLSGGLPQRCIECPYHNDGCDRQRMIDTLKLLKEQEPLAVYEGKVNKCVCGNGINRYWHPEYCGFCGKKLEWY